MQLQHISIPQLIAEAGGDPWAINSSVQSGCPAHISDLAQAFHDAGGYTAATNIAFDEARRRFEASWNRANGNHPITDSDEVQRTIATLGAQATQLPRIGVNLENIAAALAETQQTCGAAISTLETRLQGIDQRLGITLDLEKDPHLAERFMVTERISELEDEAISDTRSTVYQIQSIRTHYSDYLQSSLAKLQVDGYNPAAIQGQDASGSPTKAEPEANRRQNQIQAFTKVFGRPPSSSVDWETAAALDPHSYDPKNGGVPPNIVVGSIKPVPGQGVVRTNLFIPGRAVLDPQLDWPPTHYNLGDDRGFSPTAGPEESRVSICVDYENGIIVARQNPSIDANTGQIRAGTPTIAAVQRSNGSVLIKYSAADPFSPGGEGLAKATSFDVNGTLAIEPAKGGPQVGGTVTNFPAVEIYNERLGANTTTLAKSWPSLVDGPLGPMAGLWWHKDIGQRSLEFGFNDQYLAPKLPTFIIDPIPPVMPIVPPLIVPPPMYPLGPVDHPPEIGLHDPVVRQPTLPPK